jgi:hypothetical protein
VERVYLFQKFWNKTNTFWCVPTSFLQKQKVYIFSKNFGTKPKLFDVFQLFFSKSKTLLYDPKKFRSERERFGSIMNFVSKTNIYDFFGTFIGKRKQTIFKKCWFDITIQV